MDFNPDLPPDSGLQTVIGMIAARACLCPEQIALVDEDGSLTLGEVLRYARGIAAHLQELPGFGRGDRVGLLLPHSRHMPVGMLASVLACGAYVPIDPAWPEERQSFVLGDAGCKALVIADRNRSPSAWGGPVVNIADLDDFGHGSPSWPTPEPGEPAYMIYTSGSTGVPKGVLVEHGALANLIRGVRPILYPENAAGFREAVSAPFVFDVTVQQVFSGFAGGHCLVILGNAVRHDPRAFVDRLVKHRVQLVNMVVSQLALMLEAGLERAGAHLERIVTGGEQVPIQLMERLFSIPALAHVTVTNMYGPTENCVDSTWFDITPETLARRVRVPIGTPLPGIRVHILDDRGRPVPHGATGEICLAGKGLARGYWNREEITARAFIANPARPEERIYRTGDLGRFGEDGLLEFLGRTDDQIKIAGQRVHLGEIEHLLRRIDGIMDVAVVYHKQEEAGGRLAAFLVGDALPDRETLAREMERHLPPYMRPGAIFRDSRPLPTTHNGKVDREALMKRLCPEQRSTGPDTPGGTESALARIWCSLLGVATVDPRDKFMLLGGDSIAAMRLSIRVHEQFGKHLPFEQILGGQTLAEMARYLETAADGVAHTVPHGDRPRTAEGWPIYPASSAQSRLWYQHQTADNVVYNIPVYRVTGALDPERMRRAFVRLAERHPILRTALRVESGHLRQAVAPAISLPFTVRDLSGEPDPEAEAARWSQREVQQPFDLARPPLFRLGLLKLSEERWHFLLTIHHVLVDGWSISLLIEECNRLYSQPEAELPETGLGYGDYALWESGLDQSRSRAYWRALMHPAPDCLALPAESAAAPRIAGDTLSSFVPPSELAMFEAAARRQGTTLSAFLLTGFFVLLNRLTRQDDLCIGMGIANRALPGLERCLGCFVNVLPIRVLLNEEMDVSRIQEQVGTRVREALEHQAYPLESIVRDMPAARTGPPFNVLYAFQSFESLGRPVEGPLDVAVGDHLQYFDFSFARARFDLTLYVYRKGDGLSLIFEFATPLLSREAVTRWMEFFRRIMSMMAAEPGDGRTGT
jgi:amino acid adenylation domain-containing protein